MDRGYDMQPLSGQDLFERIRFELSDVVCIGIPLLRPVHIQRPMLALVASSGRLVEGSGVAFDGL